MKIIQAIEKQLPAHVVAAITSAAGIVSRTLEQEYGVKLGKARLRSSGLLLCDQQAREMERYRVAKGLPVLTGADRHPSPDQQEFFRDCVVGELMDLYTTVRGGTTRTLRRLAPIEETAILAQLKKRGAAMRKKPA
ncbi:hypothetical protein [Burkholderia sp. Ax-1724]|uniref:hypothetical protein n=1 Tax=Burkholderia sp. Ax-1724 TaxID=2608336 RepID=UPI00141ED2C1|nr:hypothetical protein [Burkholderia sp. Ax-1724]NIF53853.1 hypothetical protein [Burkholderia sp. Ax-1724]